MYFRCINSEVDAQLDVKCAFNIIKPDKPILSFSWFQVWNWRARRGGSIVVHVGGCELEMVVDPRLT